MATFSEQRRAIPVSGAGPLRWLWLVGAAAVGGVFALALAFATGAVHTGAATTVVQRAPAVAAGPAFPSAPWRAAYAEAAAGTAALTVRHDSIVSTPYGMRREQETVLGSGFVLDGRGDLVTAAHVVDGATSIRVAFEDGGARGAKVLGLDDASDLAILRVRTEGLALHPLRLGTSRSLAVGDALALVGDPLGFDRSLSTGVVSGLDRTIESPDGFQIAHAVQTDAAMNPGVSGGPVFDSRGRVVGIADQIATGANQFGNSTTQTSTGVGFAIPVDLITAERVALEHGWHVSHAYLGVATAGTAGAGAEQGALVSSVISGTPAAEAGLQPGDVIVAFNATRVTASADLIDALAGAKPGERVSLTIVRGNRRSIITVELAAQPSRAPAR